MTTEVIEGEVRETALSTHVEPPARPRRFDPSKHNLNLKGKTYSPVAARIVWFREDHPDGVIETEIIEHDREKGYVLIKAKVGYETYENKLVYATAYGDQLRDQFKEYVGKGETKAVGRALAFLGYGTLGAQELEEDPSIMGGIADSPVEIPRREGPRQPTIDADEDARRKRVVRINQLEHEVYKDTSTFEARRTELFVSVLGRPAPNPVIGTWSREDLDLYGVHLKGLKEGQG